MTRSFVKLATCAVALSTAVPPAPQPLALTIQNKLGLDRQAETISIPAARISTLLQAYGPGGVLVKDGQTGKFIVSQAVDNDGNGTVDELLFQTNIKANASQKFTVVGLKDGALQQPKSEHTTFSRLVPERIDDYAWENDRVAFRTYGPKAQQLTESGSKDGTLTSGMDCWLKRVSYPVIDKWYAGNLKEASYYHKDHGEGYDPYHVGASRGFAGVGVWEGDSLYVSKNFVTYKTLASGPIRTRFELTYAPWNANGRTVTEKKIISLDLGSNLTRFEERLSSDKPLPNLTIGTTLHADPKGVPGEVKGEPKQGWFRYWEPIDDSFVGTGIVLMSSQVQGWKDRRTNAKDQSHLLVMTSPSNGALTYYAGFGWTKSNQFKTAAEWDQYLAQYAQRLASPLVVSFGGK
ncbi:DUF4861 domain-containing protein [Hymenobacter terrenus]|uniref:DUF4861 domain-containing protein n=1 Tax=Hymenobacter terrenus TaxID=1629124 RepID=UPI000695C49B|nr:DUF4861 domain-containing protein [Hymenobacter terrenus]